MCEAIYIGTTNKTFKNNRQSFIWSPTSFQKRTKFLFIYCPFWTSLPFYYFTYRPTQVHDVQGSNSDQTNRLKEKYTKPIMYGGTFNNPKKAMRQTCNGYEQEFVDIRGLPAQNDFPSIFPKHWLSCLTGERVRTYNVFQTLGFENVNGCFSTGNFFHWSHKIEKVISYEKLK